LFYVPCEPRCQADTYSTKRTAQTTKQLQIFQDHHHCFHLIMTQLRNSLLPQHESRLQHAPQAYNSGQFRSHRAAARAYNVKQRVLSSRAKGITFRAKTARSLLRLKSRRLSNISSTSIRDNSRPGCAKWQIWPVNCRVCAVVSQLASTVPSTL
jgi:hypothetical protein